MMGVAQRDHCHTLSLGPGNAEFGSPLRRHLPIATLSVIDDEGALVLHHPPWLIGLEAATVQMPEISRQHPHAMAVMTAQIGLDQVIGDDGRLASLAAPGAKDPDHRTAERFDGNEHGINLGAMKRDGQAGDAWPILAWPCCPPRSA